jgi:GTP cyclohydrolase I
MVLTQIQDPQLELGRDPGVSPVVYAEVEDVVKALLIAVGENPSRDGLKDTPDRVARMYGELLAGYWMEPDRVINGALFDVEYDQMVVVKDIDFFSLCEHHMVPFFGKAAVGYLPGSKVIGLSKIPRIVEMFARRLQVQERFTQQVGQFLDETLSPRGVTVVVEATHLCAAMRGVNKPGTRMVTSAILGEFRQNQTTRDEFMAHLRGGREPLI